MVPGVFGNQQPHYLDVIKQMLGQSLQSLPYVLLFLCSSVVPGVFGNQQPHYLDVIKQMLGQSLQSLPYVLLFLCSSVVPGVFGNQQPHYLDVIKQMLGQSLQDKDHPAVWFEAVKATTAFLTTNEKEQTIIHYFKDLLPGVIQV